MVLSGNVGSVYINTWRWHSSGPQGLLFSRAWKCQSPRAFDQPVQRRLDASLAKKSQMSFCQNVVCDLEHLYSNLKKRADLGSAWSIPCRTALVVKSQPPTTKFPEWNLRDDSSPQTFIVGDFRIPDFSHLSIGTRKLPYIFCALRVVFNDSGFAMNVPFKNHTFGGVWNQISETTVWVVWAGTRSWIDTR